MAAPGQGFGDAFHRRGHAQALASARAVPSTAIALGERADLGDQGVRIEWLGDVVGRAGLVEDLGEGLWIAPGGQAEPALADWVRYGKANRIALPPALFERRAVLLGDLLAPAAPMTDMEEA